MFVTQTKVLTCFAPTRNSLRLNDGSTSDWTRYVYHLFFNHITGLGTRKTKPFNASFPFSSFVPLSLSENRRTAEDKHVRRRGVIPARTQPTPTAEDSGLCCVHVPCTVLVLSRGHSECNRQTLRVTFCKRQRWWRSCKNWLPYVLTEDVIDTDVTHILVYGVLQLQQQKSTKHETRLQMNI